MRYVDDFILLGKSKEELMIKKSIIENYLQRELKLSLRDDFVLKETKEGANFLGYIIYRTHKLVRNRVVNNFKYKKAKFLENAFDNKGECSYED